MSPGETGNSIISTASSEPVSGTVATRSDGALVAAFGVTFSSDVTLSSDDAVLSNCTVSGDNS